MELERKKKTRMLVLWAIVIAVILSIIISLTLSGDHDENQETVIFDADNSISLNDMSESTSMNSNNVVLDKSLYEYYDLLSEEWTGLNCCHDLGSFKFYFDNNKIYFINTDPDDNPGTADGYKWYYYDINTKECTTLFGDDEEPFLPASYAFVRILSSWYYNNAFYVVYNTTSYDINDSYEYISLIKMDDNGNVLNKVVFDKSTPMEVISVFDGTIIIERHNAGDFDSMKYEIYSSDLKRTAVFDLPLKTLSHGLTTNAYVTDFFEFDGNIYGDVDGILYKMDMRNALWINADISAKPSENFGKYCLSSDNDCIFDVETEEKIYEGYVPPNYHDNYFGNTYFGGNYNYELINGSWFKVQYPNRTEPDFDQYEPMGSESARYQENIVQLNDNYYIFKDRYGIFLRTYETGESQEDTILLF